MRKALRVVELGLLALALAFLSILSVYWRHCGQDLSFPGICSISQTLSSARSFGPFLFWLPIAYFSIGIGWITYKILRNKKHWNFIGQSNSAFAFAITLSMMKPYFSSTSSPGADAP